MKIIILLWCMKGKKTQVGRKKLPKEEKKIPIHAGYCKAKNRDKIILAIKPIIEKIDI